MRLDSVRARLTLWNVGVMALVLVGLGAGLAISVRAALWSSIDRDLRERAHVFAKNDRPPNPRPYRQQRPPAIQIPWHYRLNGQPDPALPPGAGLPQALLGMPQPGGVDFGHPRTSAAEELGPPPRQPGEDPPPGTQYGPPDGQPEPPHQEPGRLHIPRGGPPHDRLNPADYPAPVPEPPGRGELPAGPPEDPMGVGPGRFGGAPADPEADRAAYFRRPRLLRTDGTPVAWVSGDRAWDTQTFELSLQGRESFSTVSWKGEPLRVYSAPLYHDGHVKAIIQIAYPIAEQERLMDGLVRTLLTLFPLALLIAGVGGAFLTSRALSPVRELQLAAAQIGADDLSRRLKVAGRDEFSQLAETFNGMVGRLEQAFRNLAAAYEQQRRFTGDASHELRTPLTTIKANTSLALVGERTPAEYREALQAADEAADVMNRIVQDLLFLARSDSGRLAMEDRPVPVSVLIEKAARVFHPNGGPTLEVAPPAASLHVRGDAHHLQRLFTNILENAIRHTPADGTVRFFARDEGGMVAIFVVDTGDGIAPEHLPHLCERFYRVDASRTRSSGDPGSGTGLGLSICRSIVDAHGGSLHIGSQPGQGTTVCVRLRSA